MNRERRDVSVVFYVGKAAKEALGQDPAVLRAAEAEKLHEIKEHYAGMTGKLAVMFRHGKVTPETEQRRADTQMRAIRAELEAELANEPAEPPVPQADFTEAEAHVSPLPSVGPSVAEFSGSGEHQSPSAPKSPPVNPFEIPESMEL